MKRWAIPVTIVEYGRVALVEAETKQEALQIFRERGWDEMSDAKDFKVTKVGPCREEPHEYRTSVGNKVV